MCTVLTMDELIHVVILGVHVLEPELGDKNMNIDDVLAGVTLGCQVPHRQFQDCAHWTNQRLHLADNT